MAAADAAVRGAAMDFIFMLTRGDRTVPDWREALEAAVAGGVAHLGFKDVGVEAADLAAIAARIREAGATCCMEVVSTSAEAVAASIRTGVAIGVDRLLGGRDVAAAQALIGDADVGHLPFPGRPEGHPTRLGGRPEDIRADCARFRAAGCPGADLLAWRATEADPLALIRAAREGLGEGYLVVAGSIDSPARIRAAAEAGADAFTIGTAVFERAFAPGVPTLEGQLEAVLAACEGLPGGRP